MAHPYYRKKPGKNRSRLIWTILLALLLALIGIPWILPASMAMNEPFKTLKSVTTIPMEYEWHYSYKHNPAPAKPTDINQTDDSTSPMTLSDSYFPLTVGNRWVYEHKKTGNMMNDDSETITLKTVEIVEEKEVGDYNLYKIKTTEGSSINWAYYFVDEEGLKVTTDDRRPARHSLIVLKRDPIVGDIWQETGSAGTTSTVKTQENYTVPAGTFTCLVVETRYSKTRDRVYSTWYVKNVGIISQRHGSDSARGIDEWHLIKYSLK